MLAHLAQVQDQETRDVSEAVNPDLQKQSSDTDDGAPKAGKRGRTISREVYARCRARGMTQADAARAAGSRATTRANLAAVGSRLDADPYVAELVQASQRTSSENLDAAWENACSWARGVFEDPAATNLDKRAAAEFVGKAQGRFREQVEVHVHHHLPFRSLIDPSKVLAPADADPRLVDQAAETDQPALPERTPQGGDDNEP